MRLDDIKARVAAAEAPDEEWVTEITVQGHHIDLMENARTDIPDLLRVAEAAVAVVEMTKRVAAELLAKAEAEGVVIDDETRSALLEGNEPGHPITILAAALAPLLADR